MRLLSACCVLCVMVSPLRAVDPSRSLSQYMLESWDKKDGLPQNSVNTICQTHDGYLWFGTQEGLVRFDGMAFRVFDKFNAPPFRHSMVPSLAEDGQGRLWIGTRDGLLCHVKSAFLRYDSLDGLMDTDVRALLCDGSKLWIGTDDSGLFVRENDVIRREIPDLTTVNVLCKTGGDSLWIGTLNGLYGYFHGRLVRLDSLFSPGHAEIRALWRDGEGTLWIGTYGGGAFQFRNGVFSRADLGPGSEADLVTAIRHDRDGNLWFGTDGGGLIRRSGFGTRRFTTAHGLPINVILSMQEDLEGNLWIGTGGGGLLRISNGKFVSYTARDGLPYDMSWTVMEGADGRMWIGTDGGGLAELRAGVFSTFNRSGGMPSNVIMSVYEDARGQVWAGTRGGGVSRIDGNRIRIFGERDGLPSNVIRSLTADGRGRIWVGTEGRGVAYLEGAAWHTIDKSNGLPSNSVRALTGSGSDSVWIGTNAGLVLFDGRDLHVYDEKQGLSNPFVRCIHQDGASVWWVGTFGGGLNRFKDGRFTPIRSGDGLFDDIVFSVVEDREGFLWLTSNRGVSRVSLDELRAFADGKIDKVRCVVFDESDGMKSSECNGGSPGAWRSKDGRIWFATVKGLSVIDPSDIRLNREPPPVNVEEVIVDGETADLSGSIEFAAGSHRLEIQYTGLSFVAPRRVKFRYKLDGFDRDWVDAGSRRTAYFTNIPPGAYVFHVQACNNDGYWNTAGASLAFVLKPFFWQTWWFQLGGVGLLIGIVVGLYRLRVRTLAARQVKLERLVGEKTHQLAEQKIALEVALKDLKDTQTQLVHTAKMSSLVQLVAGMAHEINNPMTIIHGNLPHLEDRILQLTRTLEDTKTALTTAATPEAVMKAVEWNYEPVRDETMDILKSCNLAVERIKRIIVNLRNFSRLEEAELKEVDVHEGLDSAIQFIAPNFGERVTFHRRFAELPRISCFAGQLNQVFLNLILNAAESVEERNHVQGRAGGQVWIMTEEAHPENDAGRKWIRVTVKDDGMGIPPAYRDKLFDPFFTTKPIGSGTGLGLSICYGIVRKHNGRIYPVFENEHGAAFVVEIPY